MLPTKAVIILSLAGVGLSAPPYVPIYPSSSTTTTTTSTTSTTATTTTVSTTSTTTSPTTGITVTPIISTDQALSVPTERLTADTRQYLLQGVDNVDFNQVGKLDLSPRQRLALRQEFEYQQLGLAPFTDPTPWQRLSRDQQLEFNRKYLALRPELQEYSRNQFLSLPDERQEKAYNTFIRVDIETLSRAIEREYARERAVLERRSQEEKRRMEENIQRLLTEKRMQYSSMNAEIVTDILDNNVDNNQGSDLIQMLKQQLSNSLQVDTEEEVTTTTTNLPEVPRNSNIKFNRLNDIADEYLISSSVKTSARVPKSNSSILSARASLFARRLQSGPSKSVSTEDRRSNIQRLMYDPRRKL